MTHPFETLSPERAIDMIETLGFMVDRDPFALNSYENRVFDFQDENRRRFILKVYRPDRWTSAQRAEELQFIEFLAQSGVPVGTPWQASNGQVLHRYEDFDYAIFNALPGQAPELDNPNHLFALGELVGKLHHASRGYSFSERPVWAPLSLLEHAASVVLESGFLSHRQAQVYEKLTTELISQARSWPLESLTMFPVHGDCHIGNILGREDEFGLVDFDDARTGPAITDLWLMLTAKEASEAQGQLSELLEGYEQHLDFDRRELDWVERLRAVRMVRHAAWIVERWSDPAFPAAFNWVGNEAYWDDHLKALEQQRHALSDPLWLA
ncbi:serine/threonine protein kinase [Larsenimonas salina]|uniref:serine/threonine protein kinase n=1 Tax=Larsenimonas salina TaxID=1295565 RepID=UPI002073205D|nr:serine/threonine protein kinase [Larsenimonas salina]MCM5703394.1 serine/threonine protein kinase [Larsenimonas salina]